MAQMVALGDHLNVAGSRGPVAENVGNRSFLSRIMSAIGAAADRLDDV
jgi:hypothetical protein